MDSSKQDSSGQSTKPDAFEQAIKAVSSHPETPIIDQQKRHIDDQPPTSSLKKEAEPNLKNSHAIESNSVEQGSTSNEVLDPQQHSEHNRSTDNSDKLTNQIDTEQTLPIQIDNSQKQTDGQSDLDRKYADSISNSGSIQTSATNEQEKETPTEDNSHLTHKSSVSDDCQGTDLATDSKLEPKKSPSGISEGEIAKSGIPQINQNSEIEGKSDTVQTKNQVDQSNEDANVSSDNEISQRPSNKLEYQGLQQDSSKQTHPSQILSTPTGFTESKQADDTPEDEEKPLRPEFTLPNAKENSPYLVEDIKAFIFGEKSETISHYYFDKIDEYGLDLLEESDTIKGIPKLEESEPIELQVSVHYHLREHPRSKPQVKKGVLLIIPDPTKLWKNIPSDRKVSYWKEDEVCSIVQSSVNGILFGASKRGRTHAHSGTCRDDDYEILEESGWWVSIVADGAGSSKYSRKGSRVACQTAIEKFKELKVKLNGEEFLSAVRKLETGDQADIRIIESILNEVLVRQIGYQSFKAVFDLAKIQEDQTRDYHTTFLLSIWRELSNNSWFISTFTIGDGGIAVLHDDKVTTLSTGDEGEYSGETLFLTSNSVWSNKETLPKRLQFQIIQNPRLLVSMSDGVTDPKFETEYNFRNPIKWEELESDLIENVLNPTAEEKVEQKLLKWLDFWSPGNHDDRTITIFQPSI